MGHKCSDELKMELTGEIVHFIPFGGVLDTSDATATEDDMPLGVTAYARGEKLTGRVRATKAGVAENIHGNGVEVFDDEYMGTYANAEENIMVRKDTVIHVLASKSLYGNAVADQVEEGATFTSAAGLRVRGTRKNSIEAAMLSGVCIWKKYAYDGSGAPEEDALAGYVLSPARSTFPDNGAEGQWWYVYQGTVGEAGAMLPENDITGTGNGDDLIIQANGEATLTAGGSQNTIIITTSAAVRAVGDTILIGG